MNGKQSVERLQGRKHGITTRFAFGWIFPVALLLLAGGAFATPVAAASSSESGLHYVVSRTLTSPNSSPEGAFGLSSAVSGNTVVVGAWNETANGFAGAGHAYIYSAKTGALLHTLTSPNAQTNGEFGGFTVAASGNTVVVGAWNEAANGYAGAGHAYIYNAATGALLHTLTSPNAQTNGNFANAVAVSGDIVVVGAWNEAADGYAYASHAYVFNTETGALLRTLTSPNAQTDGHFGSDVALAGNVVAVGAENETTDGYSGAGHAYLFNVLTGKLIRTLTSPNAVTDGAFGSTLAAAGNILAVGAQTETADGYAGAGHTYIYSAATGALITTLTSPNAQTNGEFGWTLGVTGNIVVVGAWLETGNGYAGAGNAYVFNSETGALITMLTSQNSQTNGGFGFTAAASGNVVVVGAWFETADGYAGAGHAYIYYIGPLPSP
jgi:hypothetical protein